MAIVLSQQASIRISAYRVEWEAVLASHTLHYRTRDRIRRRLRRVSLNDPHLIVIVFRCDHWAPFERIGEVTKMLKYAGMSLDDFGLQPVTLKDEQALAANTALALAKVELRYALDEYEKNPTIPISPGILQTLFNQLSAVS
jgi:hypothetical protein